MTTLETSRAPEVISIVVPLSLPSTTWPPVTFVNAGVFKRVGTKAGVVLNAEAGTLAPNTWYDNNA